MENIIIHDGKKFMWDGETYATVTACQKVVKQYMNDGFETKTVDADGVYFLYTRRVVTDIEIEGSPV